jgi:hypothetical protein
VLGQRSDGELLLFLKDGTNQPEEARSDVFDYIERFYNPVRKHSKLDYLLGSVYGLLG